MHLRALALIGVAAPLLGRAAHAQLQVRWAVPDEQPLHAVALGASSEIGYLGARYVRFLPRSPVAVWAGAGTNSAGVGLDLLLPHVHWRYPPDDLPDLYELYLTAGWMTRYGRGYRFNGAWLTGLGLRRWDSPHRRWFTDVAFGGTHNLWGVEPPALALRLQVGATF